MPKNNLLISAALTGFVLVVATGVVSAYKQAGTITASTQSFSAVQPVEMPVTNSTEVVAPSVLAPQEAALVAANFLGRTDLYSVEFTVWNGTNVYKVTFSSGDVVYVDVNGQVLGNEPPQTVYVSNNNGAGGGSANRPPRYDDDEGHEGHEDD